MQNLKDVRDRTDEFFHTVETFRKLAAPSNPQNERRNHAARQPAHPTNQSAGEESASSELTQAASEISSNISTIEKHLRTLKQLAARQSLFNDPVQEINQITHVVKQSISQREAEIKLLSGLVSESTQHTQQQQHSYQAIVDDLKAQLARNTKVFTEILQLRNKNLKQQNSRRQNFESQTAGSGGLRKRAALNFGQFEGQSNNYADPAQAAQLQMDSEEMKYHKGRLARSASD